MPASSFFFLVGVQRDYRQLLPCSVQVHETDFLCRHEGRDQQRIHRQSRRAGHERRRDDRRDSVAAIGNNARCHDSRDRAGEARDHGDNRLSGKTDGAHNAIHQVRRTRQVAGILEQDDEQEQYEDLRQKDDDAAHTGDDAVRNQARQRPVAKCRVDTPAQYCRGAID